MNLGTKSRCDYQPMRIALLKRVVIMGTPLLRVHAPSLRAEKTRESFVP